MNENALNPVLIMFFLAGLVLGGGPNIIGHFYKEMVEKSELAVWISIAGYLIVACCLGYAISSFTRLDCRVITAAMTVVTFVSCYGLLAKVAPLSIRLAYAITALVLMAYFFTRGFIAD